MTMAEAISQVSKAYVIGVDEFYRKVDPNPWQKAHDTLSSALMVNDKDVETLAYEAFVSRCLELIEAFKKTAIPPKGISIPDAFHIADEERLSEIQSRKRKECFKCASQKDLHIISSPRDERSAVLACSICKLELKARRKCIA